MKARHLFDVFSFQSLFICCVVHTSNSSTTNGIHTFKARFCVSIHSVCPNSDHIQIGFVVFASVFFQSSCFFVVFLDAPPLRRRTFFTAVVAAIRITVSRNISVRYLVDNNHFSHATSTGECREREWTMSPLLREENKHFAF